MKIMTASFASSLSAKRSPALEGVFENIAQAQNRRDRSTFSVQGKNASRRQQRKPGAPSDFLSFLNERKESLLEARRELTAQKGTLDEKTYQRRMDTLTESIRDIESQMKEYMLEKQKKALEAIEEKREKKEQDEPKTKQEAFNEQMQNLAESKNSLDTMSKLSRTKAELERSAGYMQEGMDNDKQFEGARAQRIVQRAASAQVGDYSPSPRKTAALDKLKEGIENLEEQNQELLKSAQELVKDTAEHSRAQKSKDEKTPTGENQSDEKTALEKAAAQNEGDEDKESQNKALV